MQIQSFAKFLVVTVLIRLKCLCRTLPRGQEPAATMYFMKSACLSKYHSILTNCIEDNPVMKLGHLMRFCSNAFNAACVDNVDKLKFFDELPNRRKVDALRAWRLFWSSSILGSTHECLRRHCCWQLFEVVPPTNTFEWQEDRCRTTCIVLDDFFRVKSRPVQSE